MKFLKSIWRWLGKPENHNAAMVIIALITATAALFQINNIRITVETLSTDIKSFYAQNYIREIFEFKDIRNPRAGKIGTDFTLELKEEPIPNSLNVWWYDNQILGSQYYDLNGKTLTLHFVDFPLETFNEGMSLGDGKPFITVNYFKTD